MANFRTRARAVDLLGKQQIRDEVTAISELLRNSYDADASEGVIDVDTMKERIIVWDDGDGMDEIDLIENWLTLGTYSKKMKHIRRSKKNRVKIGEKGIGRLAISLLGDLLLLISKKRSNDAQLDGKWALLFLHWELFRNENLYIEEIEIPVISFDNVEQLKEFLTKDIYILKSSLLSNLNDKHKWTEDVQAKVISEIDSFEVTRDIISRINHIEKKQGGTIFFISDLANSWNWEVYNTAVQETNLLYRKQRLKDLLYSFSNFVDLFESQIRYEEINKKLKDVNNEFSPRIHINGIKLENEMALSEEDINLFDYALKGEIVDGAFEGLAFIGGQETSEKVIVSQNKLTHGMMLDSYHDCGPIKIKWFFVEGQSTLSSIPKDKHTALSKKLDKIGGLYVFRDGLRILPYGEPGNDFLNMEERRTKNAGRYLFSFRRMYGYIEISKELNAHLVDKSSREGFIENTYYQYFRSILVNLLLWWALDFLGTSNRKGKRNQYIEESKKEVLLLREKEKEAKEEKKYFQKLDRYLRGFDNSIQTKESDIIRRIKKSVKEIDDGNNFVKKIELYTLVDEIDEIRFIVNKRYEHNYEIIDLLGNCDNEIKKKKEELKSSIDQILDKISSSGEVNYELLVDDINKRIVFILNDLDIYIDNIEQDIQSRFQAISEKVKESYYEEIYHFKKQLREEIIAFQNEFRTSEKDKITTYLKEKSAYLQDKYFDFRENVKLSEKIESLSSMLTLLESRISNGDLLDGDNVLIGALKAELSSYRELSSVGLAAELTSHEFNSLHSAMRENLNKLSTALKNTRVSVLIENTLRAFKSLEKLHQRMSPLYKQTRNVRKNIHLKEFINNSTEYFSSDLKKFKIKIINEISDELVVFESEPILFAPIINVLSNAIYWLLNARDKEIHFYTSTNGDKLYIHDTGSGIGIKDSERIFEPFYTKREGGRGLGLYLSKDILQTKGHDLSLIRGGSEIKSLPGACFCIDFSQSR